MFGIDRIQFIEAGQATSFGKFATKITRVTPGRNGSPIIAYQAILNQDFDGDPHCYGPPELGFSWNLARQDVPHDELRMATNDAGATFVKGTHSWLWNALVHRTPDDDLPTGFTLDERPELKDKLGRYPVKKPDGFYISKSAVPAAASSNEFDQTQYWNAAEVAYSALTPALTPCGVKQFDVGIAIRNDTGDTTSFMFADAGAAQKVGECSARLFQSFFPHFDQEGHPVSFLVFPGSKTSVSNDKSSKTALERAIRLKLKLFSGLPNISDLALFFALGADPNALDRYTSSGKTRADVERSGKIIGDALISAGLS